MTKHGFHHKHSLGQNFIENEALLEQLAALSLATAEDCVLEIGPGAGGLTRPLARRAKQVLALEIDQTLLPVLRVTLTGYDNARVLCADVMQADLPALTREAFGEDASLRVAANLPYYITTDVLMKLLRTLPRARSFAVMVQKEVGDKLLSAPGDAGYGPLAVFCQYACHVRRALDVPASCFTPPPKVDSSFMVLERRDAPPYDAGGEDALLRTVRVAFAMRRKTLCNNLTAGLSLTRAEAEACLSACGIDPRARAEALPLEMLCALSRQLAAGSD